jgi:hypothetical protein
VSPRVGLNAAKRKISWPCSESNPVARRYRDSRPGDDDTDGPESLYGLIFSFSIAQLKSATNEGLHVANLHVTGDIR